MAVLRSITLMLLASMATAQGLAAQTSGQVTGTIDGRELDLPVTCNWQGEDVLEIKSHEFTMLSERFETRPALHASFYNNNYFLVVLAGDEHYRMAGRDPDGGLRPREVFHHEGTVPRQTGHDGPYDFDLTLNCPR